MRLLERLHARRIHPHRVRVLGNRLASLIPKDARLVDVGCGDGALDAALIEQRPDIRLTGLDIMRRQTTSIPVDLFDGRTLPFEPRSMDAVLFVDALHHAEDPHVLLREAARVARRTIIIKDHTCDGPLAETTLRFMDRIGNARHGVSPGRIYWPKRRWLDTFDSLGLSVAAWEQRLGLYPWPAGLLFERSLHFVAALDVSGNGRKPGAEAA